MRPGCARKHITLFSLRRGNIPPLHACLLLLVLLVHVVDIDVLLGPVGGHFPGNPAGCHRAQQHCRHSRERRSAAPQNRCQREQQHPCRYRGSCPQKAEDAEGL